MYPPKTQQSLHNRIPFHPKNNMIYCFGLLQVHIFLQSSATIICIASGQCCNIGTTRKVANEIGTLILKQLIGAHSDDSKL